MRFIRLKYLSTIVVSVVAMTIFWACSATQKNTNMSVRQSILRKVYPVLTGMTRMLGVNSKVVLPPGEVAPVRAVYDIPFELIDGQYSSLSAYRGKKIIVVNTASDCGYTAQYESLQALYASRKQDLVIVGFPANDFKKQEKGSNEEIASFCKKNYGVEFPMAMKTSVIKGNEQHPLFKWLSDPAANGWNQTPPSWNFSKYVLDEEGKLIAYCDPSVEPMSEIFLKIINTPKP